MSRKRIVEEIERLPLMTRIEARAAGSRHYFTGEPCLHGHIARRFVSNKACMICMRVQTREWHRAKFLANPAAETRYRRQNAAANGIGELIRRAKSRAKLKGVPFSITRADLVIPEECPCCGHTMKMDAELRGSGNPYIHGPTLDRFDPALGYVPGNTNVICWQCNSIKHSATSDQLRLVADWMDGFARQRLKLVS
jgi:hypothetical protein